MLALAPGAVHLWFAFEKDIDSALFPQYRRCLIEEELIKEQRFYFAKDRRRYLITRTLVREVLSRYCPVRPEAWRFSSNAYGRPEICADLAEEESTRNISFNISHTDGLVMMGVARGCELGVDTENVNARQVSLDIADRFFSMEETSALWNLPMHQQHQRFFEYWTLKESYIKALGKGLSVGLDQFGFILSGEKNITPFFRESLHDHPSHWRFLLFKPSFDHLAAICIEQLGERHRITMNRIVPFHSVEPLVCQTLRSSS